MSRPDPPGLRLTQPGPVTTPPTLAQPDRGATVHVVPHPANGVRRLERLDDVDVSDAPVDAPVVWRQGVDGIWRVEAAAEGWSTPVQFSQERPDPEQAPRGALWVELGDELRIHERR